MFDSADPIPSLHMRLSIHRRTVGYLEEQRARFGAFTPPYIHHQLEEAWTEIARIKQELAVLGASADEHPNDQPSFAPNQAAFGLDVAALQTAYQRMLVDQTRYVSLVGLGERSDTVLSLADMYTERTPVALGPGAPIVETLTELVGTPRARILLEGAAGSGKTTALRRLTLAVATHALNQESAGQLASNWLAPPLLPIMIDARDLVDALGRPVAPGASAFWTTVEGLLQRNELTALLPTIQQTLQNGKGLVLIDGLDDDLNADHVRVIAMTIGRFVARYPDNRYVVTCRNRSAVPLAALAGFGFAHYGLAPLDDAQIDAMIAAWYPAVLETVGHLSLANQHAQTAVFRGHMFADERLHKLAGLPLALIVAIVAHAEGHAFPLVRTVMFERLLHLLFDHWEHLRSDGAATTLGQLLEAPALSDPAAWLALLRPVALAFQNRPDYSGDEPARLHLGEIEPLIHAALEQFGVASSYRVELITGRLLDWCCHQGILARIDGGHTYTMPMRPLREYLAAGALALAADMPQRVYSLRNEPRWRETLLLATQALSGETARSTFYEVLRLLLEGAQGRRTPNDLLFAAECLLARSDKGADRALRAHVRDCLLALLRARGCSVAERVHAGVLLGHLDDPRFANLLPPLANIPGGPFVLGTDEGYDDEGPALRVDVPTFAIGLYPVTNREYSRFLEDEPEHMPPRYWYDPRFNTPSQPVVGVTWKDAIAFCHWLTRRLHIAGLLPHDYVVRLPSEAEWEKAASWDQTSHTKRRYPWGDEWLPQAANTAEGRGAWTTTAVGCYPEGISPYGLHDMIGNVWEWTASVYASYSDGVAGPSEEGSYTLRGSSCVALPIHARCTYRSRLPAHFWRYHLGFRVVLARPS